jgi:hypothetical protein
VAAAATSLPQLQGVQLVLVEVLVAVVLRLVALLLSVAV